MEDQTKELVKKTASDQRDGDQADSIVQIIMQETVKEDKEAIRQLLKEKPIKEAIKLICKAVVMYVKGEALNKILDSNVGTLENMLPKVLAKCGRDVTVGTVVDCVFEILAYIWDINETYHRLKRTPEENFRREFRRYLVVKTVGLLTSCACVFVAPAVGAMVGNYFTGQTGMVIEFVVGAVAAPVVGTIVGNYIGGWIGSRIGLVVDAVAGPVEGAKVGNYIGGWIGSRTGFVLGVVAAPVVGAKVASFSGGRIGTVIGLAAGAMFTWLAKTGIECGTGKMIDMIMVALEGNSCKSVEDSQ